MVRHTDFEDVDATNSKYDRKSIRTTTVKKGDTVRVGIRTSPTADPVAVTGTVDVVYGDDKFALQVEGESPEGRAYMIRAGYDDDCVRRGNHYDGFGDEVGHPVFVQFPDDEDGGDARESDETLSYENTTHGAHEKTGKSFTRTKTVEVEGHTHRTHDRLTSFKSPDHDGLYFVLADGTVEFEPHDPNRSRYEVGDNGQIEGGR